MAEIAFITPAAVSEEDELKTEKASQRAPGNVRLRDHDNGRVILVPSPTSDPNDPLNWPQWYKRVIASLVCVTMMWCNFLAAGPTTAIVRTTLDFFPDAGPPTSAAFKHAVAKVAFFFTTTALLQGLGNFFWVPLANKYGRRPVYLASYVLYLGCAVWLIFEKTFPGFLAARILLGFASGAAETIAPMTIADIFFLHERGTVMGLYSAFLSIGVAFGIIMAGWRVIYETAAAIVGFILLTNFFCFPETAYLRTTASVHSQPPDNDKSQGSCRAIEETPPATPAKKTYLQSLRVFHGTLTEESLHTMVLRPLSLVCLPPVLWTALVQSVTIGFLVAVTSNVAMAFKTAYGFAPYQVGLCFIAAVVGSVLGIPAGGWFGDAVADWLTRRNAGVREPEMRLPAIALSMFTTPVGLMLFGSGIQHRLHWMVPTVGLGLLNFSIAQGTNICLVYVIDSYRPVMGEITLAVMGFKSLFGFLLSFYTYPWVNKLGYDGAYGTMASIAFFVILLWVPLYVWGRRIRRLAWNWRIMSLVHWNDDREVGE